MRHADLPWARAVIRDGRITLHEWRPGLMTGGPQRPVLAGLAERGVVLADLRCDACEDGSQELRVEWIPAGVDARAAAAAVVEWSERVGYRRVWLPDRVIDLSDALFTGGRAEVTCPTCGLRWDDASPEFWAMVRGHGHFPDSCPACNGSLPEWELVPVGSGQLVL